MSSEYRSAIGFIFTDPKERNVTTSQGASIVADAMLSAVGLNGDVVIQLTFWNTVPDFVKTGVGVLVSGKFDPGKPWTDKDGNERTTKSISVNKIVPLGENAIVRGGAQTAPKRQRPKPVEVDDLGLDDDGF